jgi:hypothetical protein
MTGEPVGDMMRPMAVRSQVLLVAIALSAGCQTHRVNGAAHPFRSDDPQGCRYHSCPGPTPPHDTLRLALDGVPFANFRARTAVDGERVHRARLVVHVEPGTSIGAYTVGEAGQSYGSGPQGLVGVHVIQRGNRLVDGQVLTFAWRPTVAGKRSLVVFYRAVAPRKVYPYDGQIGTSVGDFQVS